MDLKFLVDKLNLNVRCCEGNLKREVLGGYVGDLLSDVMANSKKGDIWVTRQIHQNIVAVASLKDHAGIILVQGVSPEEDTLGKASKEGIPVMISELSAFETVGKIYQLMNSK